MALPVVFGMAGLVTALIQGLRWLFMSRLGLFIASALMWLGIAIGTNALVLGPTIALLHDFMAGGGGGGGEYYDTARRWAGVLNFDKAVTMIVSAYVSREVLAKGRLFLFKRGTGG